MLNLYPRMGVAIIEIFIAILPISRMKTGSRHWWCGGVGRFGDGPPAMDTKKVYTGFDPLPPVKTWILILTLNTLSGVASNTATIFQTRIKRSSNFDYP